MAAIPRKDPGSSEIRSPMIAGIIEAVSYASEILNMGTERITDAKMDEVYIDDSDRYRIYQIAAEKRLWVNSPEPVIKINGIAQLPEVAHFELDPIGGSITFQDGYELSERDTVTASATIIKPESILLKNMKDSISQVKDKTDRYKGFFRDVEQLKSKYPTGSDGDFALIGGTVDSLFVWDTDTKDWKNIHVQPDLDQFYTQEETNNLLNAKEPNIAPKGDSLADDRQYWGGRKSWQDFDATARAVPLTGLQTGSKEPVAPTDTILQAMGKLAGSAQEVREKGYLEGTGEPETGTAGKVGQRYVNTSTGKWYTCVGVQDGTYTWKEGLNAEPGKGLSTNDFTTPEKKKLATLGERKELLFTATAEGWSAEKPFTQTIQVEGAVEKCDPFFDLQPAGKTQEAKREFAKVDTLETKDGSVVLTAEKKPTANLNIRVWVK